MIASLLVAATMMFAQSSCQLPVWSYTDLGAVSIYDPAQGGINCDGDCGTVSMGQFHEDMYYIAGACVPELYGATVYFPYLDQEFHCVDQGGAVQIHYVPWANECGVYFDMLWPLDEEPAPDWAMWYLEWEIVKWGGAWDWYQAEIAPQLEAD